MFGRARRKLPLKSNADILAMRRAGLVTGSALCASALAVRPGMTTKQIDDVGFDVMKAAGATTSFLGYHGFPATLCISVNDEVVHGIPGDRVVAEGDVVSLDCGAVVDGWHGDSALTFVVGADDADPARAEAVVARHRGEAAPVTPEDLSHSLDEKSELVLVTERALYEGMAAVTPGERLNLVGVVIEDAVRAPFDGRRSHQDSYDVIDGYTGHGVGRELHMEPTVYNEAVRERLPRMEPGMVIAIEPMVAATYETYELDDGWTVKTQDGSLAAHFEHTVALTERGLWVLTAHDGGRSWLGSNFGGLD